MIHLDIGDHCPVCRFPIQLNSDEGALLIPETHVAGLETDGDPSRIIAYHPRCAPQFVLDYHKWIEST